MMPCSIFFIGWILTQIETENPAIYCPKTASGPAFFMGINLYFCIPSKEGVGEVPEWPKGPVC